jgi:hypothetical protein
MVFVEPGNVIFGVYFSHNFREKKLLILYLLSKFLIFQLKILSKPSFFIIKHPFYINLPFLYQNLPFLYQKSLKTPIFTSKSPIFLLKTPYFPNKSSYAVALASRKQDSTWSFLYLLFSFFFTFQVIQGVVHVTICGCVGSW